MIEVLEIGSLSPAEVLGATSTGVDAPMPAGAVPVPVVGGADGGGDREGIAASRR